MYKPSGPWSPEDTEDEPLFTIRDDSYFHNVANRPFASVPLNYHIDGFNAHGMQNKKSVGGSYFGWAWNSLSLQRTKQETHIGTVASPGSSCEGEMFLQCKIVRGLQTGCIATACVPAPDGSCKQLEVSPHHVDYKKSKSVSTLALYLKLARVCMRFVWLKGLASFPSHLCHPTHDIYTQRSPPPPPLSVLPEKVFVRGGISLIVADSPKRALMLYCKHPNRKTLHPCPYCLVDQPYDDPEGGSLRDANYDIIATRRTRGQVLEGRRELEGIASAKAQSDRSMELGVVAPDVAHPVMPLYDLVKIDPLKTCTVESLHVDALVSVLSNGSGLV